MKVFLDDCRPCPEGYLPVRTFEACMEVITSLKTVPELSLDYDLGGIRTGYDVLTEMSRLGLKPTRIHIHSSHPLGRKRMQDYIEMHFPDAELIME